MNDTHESLDVAKKKLGIHRMRKLNNFLLIVFPIIVSILLTGFTLMPIVYEKGSILSFTTTFSAPIKINDNTNEPSDQAYQKGLIMPNGKMFVAWRDGRLGHKDVYSAISDESISSFLSNKKINSRSSDMSEARDVAIAFMKRNVYVVWEEDAYSSFHTHIFFSKSTDGGNTFSSPIRVDDVPWSENDQKQPAIAVTEDGTVIVAWINKIKNNSMNIKVDRVRLAIYDSANNTFSKNFELPNYFNSTSCQTSVSLAVNNGYVYIAFLDNWMGKSHPYLTWSSDSCRSFLPKKPLRLDICDNPNAEQRKLTIASYPKGSIIAAWEDTRNDYSDIYGAIIHRYRDLMGENFRIDDGPVGTAQESPAIVMDRNNGIFVAWSDDRYSDSTEITWGVRFSYGRCDNLPITFPASVSVFAPARGEEQFSPSICTDGTGKVYITYSRQDAKATQLDVYLSAGIVSSTSSIGAVVTFFSAMFLISAVWTRYHFTRQSNQTHNDLMTVQRSIARAFEPCHSLPTAVRAVSGTALILR
ncbi:MAG: hypothetical protein QW505_05795 [Thermoplasmata archaeon]